MSLLFHKLHLHWLQDGRILAMISPTRNRKTIIPFIHESMSDSNHHRSCCKGIALGLKNIFRKKPCSKKLDSSRFSSFSKIPTVRRWCTSSVGPKCPCIAICSCSVRLIASSTRISDRFRARCNTFIMCCSSSAVVDVARMVIVADKRTASAVDCISSSAVLVAPGASRDNSVVKKDPLVVVEPSLTLAKPSWIDVMLARIALNMVNPSQRHDVNSSREDCHQQRQSAKEQEPPWLHYQSRIDEVGRIWF